MANSYTDTRSARNQDAAIEVLKKLGLLAFGAGVGARGFRGLVGLGSRNMNSTRKAPFLREPISIPVPAEDEQEKYAEITRPFMQAFKGDVKNPLTQPWVMPAAVLGAPLLAYSGYQLTDKLMDWRRKKERDARLEQAKQDYEAALRGTNKTGEALDQLYELCKESGDWIEPDTAGLIAGSGITLAGLLGIGSGMLTYDMSKGKQPSEVLREAKKRRDRERMQRTPPPIFARVGYDAAPGQDELDGYPLDKDAEDTTNSRQPETAVTPNPIPVGSESNASTDPSTSTRVS